MVKPGRGPSMHDVAARAGVSHQTVSRVLNDFPRIRPETRDRVLAAIDELGYRRNVGEVIALNGLIFLLKGLWPGFSNNYFVVAIFAWMIVAGIDVFYIERSQHYNK